MNAEWRRRPPVHWLVAGFLGHKPPREALAAETPASNSAEDFNALMAAAAALRR